MYGQSTFGRDATFFFLTMLRQHSQYDTSSRLGFSFRVFVRVGLGLAGFPLGLAM